MTDVQVSSLKEIGFTVTSPRPWTSLCFCAGLIGLLVTGPLAIIFDDDLDGASVEQADMMNESIAQARVFFVLSFVVCVLGVVLWRRGRPNKEVQSSTSSE